MLDLDKLFLLEETKCPGFRSHPSLLARYTDIFVRHEIDLPTFATLTDEELKFKERLAVIDGELAAATQIKAAWAAQGIAKLEPEKKEMIDKLRSAKHIKTQLATAQGRLSGSLKTHAGLGEDIAELQVEVGKRQAAQQE